MKHSKAWRLWVRSQERGAMAAVFVGAVLALGIAGCGSNDPYSLLQQNPGDMLPPLSAPVPANGTFQVKGFGVNGSDGFQFYSASSYTGQPNVTAPARGTVESIDGNLNPGLYAITIYHSPLLTTRTSGLQTTSSIQIGSYVNGGDVIGTMPVYSPTTSTPIQLDVYVNGSGAAVCPLSYLSSAARVAFQLNQFGGQFPCVQ